MEKDKIYEELAKVNIDVNKLREECWAKTELSDSLRRAHVDQQAEIHHATLEIERLAQELNAKSEEIREIKQMCEELQSDLHRKEMFLQQISCENKKLQAEHREKILKLESGNRDFSVTLDEATSRINDLERKVCVSDEEIAGLKRILSVKTEKYIEMQKNASKDLKDTEEYVLRLEEETRITKDQLKWKTEQFTHLEEAHDKLQTQFQASVVEWQKEESTLISEVSRLLAALDDQNRISEGLENRLRMCNQALAQEQGRKKVLEIQLSHTRSQNVFQDCQAAQSEIEQITMKRGEEISELHNLLSNKDMLANEMGYWSVRLEEENKDLTQLNNCAMSSLKMMREKLQGLEQLHGKCASNIKEKEAEWNYQTVKLKEDLRSCLSELDGKSKSIGKIHEELEDCQLLLEVKNEERFFLIMVLKSEFYATFSMICDENVKLGMCMKQIEAENMVLKQQMELENTKLNQVHAELKQRCSEIAALTDKVESLDSMKEKKNLIEEELKRYKEMLDESNECQHHLKEQCLKLENSLRENIKTSSDAIGKVNSELANKTSEVYKSKLDLQQLKTEADTLKLKLEENKLAHKQEMDERNQIILNLEKEVGDLSKKVEFQEKGLIEFKQETLELKRSLKSKKSNMKALFENERSFEGLLEELKKASIYKEASLSQLEGICGRFGGFCRDDVKLMDMLEAMLQTFEDKGGKTLDLLASGGLNDTTFSPSRKSFHAILDERTPLTELNF